MQYIVQHTAVGIQGRTLNQGDVIDGSDLGEMVDRLVEVGAITPVGPTVTVTKSSDVDAEIQRLRAINAEAIGIIEVMTDEELAEMKGRQATKKAEPVTRESLSELTKGKLGEMCESLGIKYDKRSNKDEIIDVILSHK